MIRAEVMADRDQFRIQESKFLSVLELHMSEDSRTKVKDYKRGDRGLEGYYDIELAERDNNRLWLFDAAEMTQVEGRDNNLVPVSEPILSIHLQISETKTFCLIP
jgi:hypothetical protein